MGPLPKSSNDVFCHDNGAMRKWEATSPQRESVSGYVRWWQWSWIFDESSRASWNKNDIDILSQVMANMEVQMYYS